MESPARFGVLGKTEEASAHQHGRYGVNLVQVRPLHSISGRRRYLWRATAHLDDLGDMLDGDEGFRDDIERQKAAVEVAIAGEQDVVDDVAA